MKSRSVPVILLILIAAAASSAARGALPSESFGVGIQWGATQAVQADRQGHVYLLRADTLEVYPVLKNGSLGKPAKLEAASSLQGPVLKAAMGDGPGDWLLCLPFQVRWFADGKEKPVPPLPWQPHGVGFLRGSPVVSVVARPAPMNGQVIRKVGEAPPASGPAVMTFDGERWSTVVEEDWPAARDSGEILESTARSVFGDRQGKLWMSRDYAYVLDRYSAAGRRLLRVETKAGGVIHQETKDVQAPSGLSASDRAHFHPVLGVLQIADLTEGPDHRIYLAVQGQKGLSIDRYDPTQAILERTDLGLEAPGYVSLAAGRDALYIAAPHGNQGRWRISWEDLDRAAWKRVAVKGEVLPPEEAGRKSLKGNPKGAKNP
jgi:hypothetical protein